MSTVAPEDKVTVKNPDGSEPPSLWKVPDIVVLLLLPIAMLFAVIGSLVALALPRKDKCCKDK